LCLVVLDLPDNEHFLVFHDDADTVNGFSLHPILPVAASPWHQRFEVPEDDDAVCHLRGVIDVPLLLLKLYSIFHFALLNELVLVLIQSKYWALGDPA